MFDFGEPWRGDENSGPRAATEADGAFVARFERTHVRDRAVACVNLCAGVIADGTNPEEPMREVPDALMPFLNLVRGRNSRVGS